MTAWRRIFEEHRRTLLPLLVFLGVNIAVLVLVVLPLSKSVSTARSNVTQASVDLANAERLEGQAKETAASKLKAEEELARFQGEVLPKDFSSARRSTSRWVQDAARDAGLEFSSARFDWEEIRDSRLSRAHSTITLSGRYADVRRFLYALETTDEFLVLDKVSLAQNERQGAGGSTLVVTLNLSTYFVTPTQP